MNNLKVVAAGWEGFTGWLGPVEFKDGVSTEPVGRQVANQLSGAVAMVEVDADGVEKVAGVAELMANGKGMAYVEADTVVEVSQEELNEELNRQRALLYKPKISDFHTSESLLKIADELGINGVRDAAKPWNVKERSIPKLIRLILEAQQEHQVRESGVAVVKAEAEPDIVVEGDSVPQDEAPAPASDEIIATQARI